MLLKMKANHNRPLLAAQLSPAGAASTATVAAMHDMELHSTCRGQVQGVNVLMCDQPHQLLLHSGGVCGMGSVHIPGAAELECLAADSHNG